MSGFKILKEATGHRCEDCERLEYGRDLHIHHMDGDRRNNEYENLRVLCRACHFKRHAEGADAMLEELRLPCTVRELDELVDISRRRIYTLVDSLESEGLITRCGTGPYDAAVWQRVE